MLIQKVRLKCEAFKHKKYLSIVNYNKYAHYRNQVKWESRNANWTKELQVAKSAKTNP